LGGFLVEYIIKVIIIIKIKDNKKMGRGWQNQKRINRKLKKRKRGKN